MTSPLTIPTREQLQRYMNLIWTLAATDFKLRFQGSVLGYIWAVIKPLLLFIVMYYVFNSLFNLKNSGIPYYSIELLTGLLVFNFFAESSTAGMSAYVHKMGLITKIYIPKWIVVVASSLNALFVFLTSSIVLVIFFIANQLFPSLGSIALFMGFILLIYGIALGVGLLLAPLYARYRDIGMIWEVVISILMYATPIIYPLTMLPESVQRILLINPVAFGIHFSKQALIRDHFPTALQTLIFTGFVILFVFITFSISKKLSRNIIEQL